MSIVLIFFKNFLQFFSTRQSPWVETVVSRMGKTRIQSKTASKICPLRLTNGNAPVSAQGLCLLFFFFQQFLMVYFFTWNLWFVFVSLNVLFWSEIFNTFCLSLCSQPIWTSPVWHCTKSSKSKWSHRSKCWSSRRFSRRNANDSAPFGDSTTHWLEPKSPTEFALLKLFFWIKKNFLEEFFFGKKLFFLEKKLFLEEFFFGKKTNFVWNIFMFSEKRTDIPLFSVFPRWRSVEFGWWLQFVSSTRTISCFLRSAVCQILEPIVFFFWFTGRLHLLLLEKFCFLKAMLYYPVMLSHFGPAPVKTDRAVRIQ